MPKEHPAPREEVQCGSKSIMRDGTGNDIFRLPVVMNLTLQVAAYSDMMNREVIFLTWIIIPGDVPDPVFVYDRIHPKVMMIPIMHREPYRFIIKLFFQKLKRSTEDFIHALEFVDLKNKLM
jgi:hypothetical protein